MPKEIKTNEEFMIEVLKAALDFNSQIVTVATAEISGDQSGRNRTHQKKVLSNLHMLGTSYNRTLEQLYQARESELRDDGVTPEISDDIRSAVRKTIELLDSKMEDKPNRELADVSNFLEAMLSGDDLPKVETTQDEA